MITLFISGAVTGILLTYIYGLVFSKDSSNTGTNETTAENKHKPTSTSSSGDTDIVPADGEWHPLVKYNVLTGPNIVWKKHIATDKVDIDALLKSLKEESLKDDFASMPIQGTAVVYVDTTGKIQLSHITVTDASCTGFTYLWPKSGFVELVSTEEAVNQKAWLGSRYII